MGLRDRFTDAVGSFLGGALDIASESLEKAVSSKQADEPSARGTGTTAMTANKARVPVPPEPSNEDPKGLLYDPFALIDQLGYRDRPSGLTYLTLRQMARRVPTYTAILQTRKNQVANFGQRQKDKREPGFGIILRDDEASPTKQDKIRMREMEDWMLQTGSRWVPGRDSFKTFLRKLVDDSLTLDQGCFEIVRNRKGLPAEFYAMDGATIRLADVPPGAEAQQDPNQVRYVQIYDEVIISEFAAHELNFGVRNPRTDIRVNGYGFSELEMIINVITATLWAFEYNTRFFKQGTAAKGVLNFKGTVPDSKLDSFRRYWKMMISGVGNAHRIPTTNVDDLQWIDLSTDNQKMGYADWMDWLTKICCGVMQFDPAEINFNYGNSGQQGQMFGTPVEQKLKHSKDRGLKPLLDDIADWINQHLIWPLDPYFSFAFLGLDAKAEDQAIDLSKKRGEFLMTVDELRAEEDLDPLPDGQGEVILNPVWLQNKQAAEMAAQQDQMGAEGMPEEEQPTDVLDVAGGGRENGGDEFSAIFGDGEEKSLPAVTDLKKSGPGRAETKSLPKRTVKVYEIEL